MLQMNQLWWYSKGSYGEKCSRGWSLQFLETCADSESFHDQWYRSLEDPGICGHGFLPLAHDVESSCTYCGIPYCEEGEWLIGQVCEQCFYKDCFLLQMYTRVLRTFEKKIPAFLVFPWQFSFENNIKTFEWRQYSKCHYIAFHTFEYKQNENFTNMVAIIFFQADVHIWLTTHPSPCPHWSTFAWPPSPPVMCGHPLWMATKKP